MKKTFRKFSQAILVVLALVFLGAMIFAFSLGVSDVVAQVNRAVNAKPAPDENSAFNIAGAKALDLRGLVSQ